MLEFKSVQDMLLYAVDYGHEHNVGVREACDLLTDSLNLGEGQEISSATYLRLVTQAFKAERHYVGARMIGDSSYFNVFVAIDGIPGVYEVAVGQSSPFVTYYRDAEVKGPYEMYKTNVTEILGKLFYGEGGPDLVDKVPAKDAIIKVEPLNMNINIFNTKEDK